MTSLTFEAARVLTDEVKADAQAMWIRLLELYTRGAHTALKYDAWSDYAYAEFGFTKSYAYRLLEAGRVVAELPESPFGDSLAQCPIPRSEAVARELVPLRPDPEQMREAWSAVVESNGPQPTAQQVRAEVKARLRPSGAEVVVLQAAPPSPGHDIRFTRIENAADSLGKLPALDKLIWPIEPGDVKRMDLAFAFLTTWLPAAKAAWKTHKALLAKAARQERDAKRGLRAA